MEAAQLSIGEVRERADDISPGDVANIRPLTSGAVVIETSIIRVLV